MNRIAIDLGFVQIYWYSLCILVGMIVGMTLVYKEAARKGISEDLMTNMIFYTVIWAIIGARTYYVVFEWSYYSKHFLEVFEIWNGGLAIHGGIIAGCLYLTYFTRKHKLDTFKIFDICCVGLIIGQVCGRWGNFFNQEAFGPAIERSTLESFFLPSFIIDGMNIDGVYHQPTFLYESLWNLIGFIILLFVRRRKYLKVGQLTGIYLMWYSVGRFFIEALRQDSLMLGSLKMAQIISIGMFVFGLFLFVFRLKKSRFEYLYNQEDLNV